VSVPNGATLNSNNLDYLDNCIDYFEDKEKIILAVDADEAGQALRYEFIRRLGAEVCYLVDFNGNKDANEYLIEHGAEELNKLINSATQVPLEGVSTLRDLEADLLDFVHNGFKPGFQIGLDNFDKIFSTYTSQFITVTGIPSSGKSDFVDQMCIGYNGNKLLIMLMIITSLLTWTDILLKMYYVKALSLLNVKVLNAWSSILLIRLEMLIVSLKMLIVIPWNILLRSKRLQKSMTC
jgi:5S rRNA maturation endonuclease (ribonuclease M5)